MANAFGGFAIDNRPRDKQQTSYDPELRYDFRSYRSCLGENRVNVYEFAEGLATREHLIYQPVANHVRQGNMC